MKYETLASEETVKRVMEAVGHRGISPEFVNTKEDALRRLQELIPPGAEIMTGGSTTLQEIGFVDLLKSGKHPWKNWKDMILAEKDEKKQNELRKRSVLSEYFLGSVHAIAETGELVIASATGSQLPSYVFTSRNVIWVAGTQKITPALDAAIKRVREHSLPLEDARMKREGYWGSTVGKLLIFERETDPGRKLTLILVNEKLGF
ncbi:hypothetical protein ANME2D_03248 [Candidatus Methanoperedens nitroreducens]|uniref:LUD domain-containing protein n=1 Tax=Candidatus Methanoperedens nitratireducens TaxID=1392998 RepID=A0A062V3K4_9EURY|nr:lactate utilization protein [Candidatus Methanoperedens nitroreducens]KCZ71213.1 hypothetical protein ANME2D_03248 [Candidatus Methanoperedens nitroreducens]MDJ1421405.1 lactate utilization protein [Candidatus Methanoperedens sp.]